MLGACDVRLGASPVSRIERHELNLRVSASTMYTCFGETVVCEATSLVREKRAPLNRCNSFV